jgi:hypothetical protein
MKLYRVEISTELFVLAENEQDARYLANRFASEEVSNGVSAFAREVTSEKQIPDEWRDSLPYRSERLTGNPQEKTCLDLVTP